MEQRPSEAAQELAQLLGATSIDPREMLKAAKKLQANFKAANDSAHAWRAKAVKAETFSSGQSIVTTGDVGGVRIFSKTEAQDHLTFGAFSNDPVSKRRAAATELATGKTLADALRAGLLR